MENIGNEIAFYIISAVVVVFTIMTIVTRKMLRAATYLLIVLFGTAAIYFQLDYHFLGAAQIAIYAGGIVVLFVFSILLTSGLGHSIEVRRGKKHILAATASILGAAGTIYAILTHPFPESRYAAGGEVDMKVIGHTLLGADRYQFVLPFELISILLLACIIGGIMIARKR